MPSAPSRGRQSLSRDGIEDGGTDPKDNREGHPAAFSEATRREIDMRRGRHHGTMTHD